MYQSHDNYSKSIMYILIPPEKRGKMSKFGIKGGGRNMAKHRQNSGGPRRILKVKRGT